MKVLYIGNFYDDTGWSKHNNECVLALNAAGVDVVPRNIKLNNVHGHSPAKVIELEQKSDRGSDIVIQNVLPHMSKYYGGIKNIIQYQTETSNFRKIGWQNNINIMDEAWVFSKYSREASKSSGVKIPINIVPMPVDTSKFSKDYGVVSNLKDSVPNNAFIFYTISEFTTRKNIETILKAFHSEFHITEPVYLLIKTSTNDQQKISNLIDNVKRGLKIYDDPHKYKKELIIFNHLPEEEIYKIHQSCHAFVTASHAEGWCLPAFDALGFGKPVIAPRHTSFVEYLNDKNSYLVDTHEDICYDALDTLPELYSASENWYNVSVTALRRQMRTVYQQKDGEAAKRALQGEKDILAYDYKSVGKIMKNYLEQIV